MTDTYLLGIGEVAEPAAFLMLRAGDRLELRLARAEAALGRSRVEVCRPDGRALGYLPPEEAGSVEGLWDAGLAVSARVTALVPVFLRPRLLLRIESRTSRAPSADAGC